MFDEQELTITRQAQRMVVTTGARRDTAIPTAVQGVVIIIMMPRRSMAITIRRRMFDNVPIILEPSASLLGRFPSSIEWSLGYFELSFTYLRHHPMLYSW